MGEMYSDHTPIPPLQAIFEGALRFGLTEDEVWRTFDDCVDEAGEDATLRELIDDLSGALARGILAKQRRSVAGDARIPSPARPR
jgi:hypothetical protein